MRRSANDKLLRLDWKGDVSSWAKSMARPRAKSRPRACGRMSSFKRSTMAWALFAIGLVNGLYEVVVACNSDSCMLALNAPHLRLGAFCECWRGIVSSESKDHLGEVLCSRRKRSHASTRKM